MRYCAHLNTDPAGYGEPPKGLQARLLLLTAEFLEAAACGAQPVELVEQPRP